MDVYVVAYSQEHDKNFSVAVSEPVTRLDHSKSYKTAPEGHHKATVTVRNGEPKCGSSKCGNPYSCVHVKAVHSYVDAIADATMAIARAAERR